MTSQIIVVCAIDSIFKLMVLKIVWKETHGHSINDVHTIILFSNPYKNLPSHQSKITAK